MPEQFLDVSDVRPVPDHQEVWGSAGRSLIVEAVERGAEEADAEAAEAEAAAAGDNGGDDAVGGAGPRHRRAGRFYFADLAEAAGATDWRVDGVEALGEGFVLFFGWGLKARG